VLKTQNLKDNSLQFSWGSTANIRNRRYVWMNISTATRLMNVYIRNKLRCILWNTDHIHRPGDLRYYVIIRGLQTWLWIHWEIRTTRSRSHWTDMVAAPSATRVFVPFIPIVPFSDGRFHTTGASQQQQNPTACPKVRCLRSANF
jgi:hypothetical protein